MNRYECKFEANLLPQSAQLDDGGDQPSVCLPMELFCDGNADCPGGVDEPENCSKHILDTNKSSNN